MNVTVCGCGRWGSFLAWYAAAKRGHSVTLYGRQNSAHFARIAAEHGNSLVSFPANVSYSSDLHAAVKSAEIIIISIGAQNLRDFLGQLAPAEFTDKTVVLCMKGIEAATGLRLTQIVREFLPDVDLAIWVGPGHVQDFLSGMPNCMIMASKNDHLTHYLVDIFTSTLIRFYYGEDLLGIEIGAAAKNVMGIAAGMLDGAHLTSLKGALMARGTHELSVLISAMGGNETTVYGLSHLGDYEATLSSEHSNNRRFGEDYIQHKPFDKLAEGVYTTEALMDLSKEYNVELHITQTIYAIVKEHKDPKDMLEQLFLRSIKKE